MYFKSKVLTVITRVSQGTSRQGGVISSDLIDNFSAVKKNFQIEIEIFHKNHKFSIISPDFALISPEIEL